VFRKRLWNHRHHRRSFFLRLDFWVRRRSFRQRPLRLKMPLPLIPPRFDRSYPCICAIRINQRLQTPFIRHKFRIKTCTLQSRFISDLIFPLPTRPTITYPPTHRTFIPLQPTQHDKRILIKLAKQIPETIRPITPF